MPGREWRPRSSSFRTIAALTILPVAGLLIVAVWLIMRKPAAAKAPAATRSSVVGSGSRGRLRTTIPLATTAPRPSHDPRPKLVIIIDDIGYASHLDRAMAIDPNLNFAVLPNSTRGSEVAERLNQRGFEILCHLPMEPRDSKISPGENAVLTSMTDREIADATRSNIAAVPHARGVNNHMGSRATADRRVMTDVMRALPSGMYFIDSRTGERSVAADVAREMNIKTAEREVFLDNVETEAAVKRQLGVLSLVAKSKGIAIGIGHPHEVTLRVLAREVPQLRAKGFRITRASEVVN